MYCFSFSAMTTDEVGGGNHADLHRVGENIGKNSVQLLTQEMQEWTPECL